MEKNKEYVVEILDNGFEGEGIAKVEGKPVFIKGAIQGEICKIVITKVLTSHAFGRLLEVQTQSKHRQEADCRYAKRCGGCDLQHMDYEATLDYKQHRVQNLVNKTLKTKVQVEKTVGMGNPFHYRNKAVFPCGYTKEQTPVMGMYVERSHEIIPIQDCLLQTGTAMQIATFIFEFIQEHHISTYNEKTGKGLVRHIMIRTAFQTNQIMCVVVINGTCFPKKEQFVEQLTKQYPEIETIVCNHNTQNTNVILGRENTVLYGKGTIEDILGDYTFEISPNSFYQVNPVQTEALYHIALEEANLQAEDIFCDLYCGIGTIGIFASKHVKEVYGIEIIEQAVQDAKANAKRNHITNATFIAGDVETLLDELVHTKKITPTVICVDPPRKGLDSHTIEQIKKLMPKKILYISCNPATLVRDLAKLEELYEVRKIQPVDCFPWTKHVECVAVLQLKENM